MHHISTTPFGRRAVSHGLLASQALAAAPAPLPAADKWQLFNDLRTARHRFGVTDRDLVVLKSARIQGDVHYDSLTIEQGAQVEGRFAPRGANELSGAAGVEALLAAAV